MKIKVLEAKHQEETLKMQQRHDADVEKVRVRSETHHLVSISKQFSHVWFRKLDF